METQKSLLHFEQFQFLLVQCSSAFLSIVLSKTLLVFCVFDFTQLHVLKGNFILDMHLSKLNLQYFQHFKLLWDYIHNLSKNLLSSILILWKVFLKKHHSQNIHLTFTLRLFSISTLDLICFLHGVLIATFWFVGKHFHFPFLKFHGYLDSFLILVTIWSYLWAFIPLDFFLLIPCQMQLVINAVKNAALLSRSFFEIYFCSSQSSLGKIICLYNISPL